MIQSVMFLLVWVDCRGQPHHGRVPGAGLEARLFKVGRATTTARFLGRQWTSGVRIALVREKRESQI